MAAEQQSKILGGGSVEPKAATRIPAVCVEMTGNGSVGDGIGQTATPHPHKAYTAANASESVSCRSETSLLRHLTVSYCNGTGVDLGAAGDPVVPWAICVDLPDPYCPPFGAFPTHVKASASKLSIFTLCSLDFVYSSHLLEDFANWQHVVLRWSDLVKPGGYLVILVPDRQRFRAAVAAGQGDNLAHRHEFAVGELSDLFRQEGNWDVLRDELPDPKHYTILFVARKQ